MKKQILIIASIGIGVGAYAQNKTAPSKTNLTATRSWKYKSMDYSNIPYNTNHNIVTAKKEKALAANQTVVGTTFYDLQSNASMQNRIVKDDNGKIHVIWTTAPGTSGAYAQRGTGYNYFDGTSWGVPTKIRFETKRTGFPSIAVLPDGAEWVINHNTDYEQLQLNSRAKRTDDWKEDTLSLAGPIQKGSWWPRIMNGGIDGKTLHVISITYPDTLGVDLYQGLNGALTYSRSTDGGATWDIVHKVPEGLDANSYIGFRGDEYALDVKGETVAIVAGGGTKDVVLLKSTDNGSTWTKTVIDTFPIPKYDASKNISDVDGDGIGDIIQTNDGSLAVLVDNNGTVHIFYGSMAILQDKPNDDNSSYFPKTDSLRYWNENMGKTKPVVIASMRDVDGDGTIFFQNTDQGVWPFGTYGQCVTSFPTAGIDANGYVYLAYSSVVENPDANNNEKDYRHIYLMRSKDGGNNWSAPIDIINGANANITEAVFPSMARKVDDKVHLVFQQDLTPGIGVYGGKGSAPDPDNFGIESDIIYYAFPVSEFDNPSAIKDQTILASKPLIFPNPASGNAKVNFTIDYPADVNISVLNIMGQKVTEVKKKMEKTGLNQVELDLSTCTPGIYFVNSMVGNKLYTDKVVIK